MKKIITSLLLLSGFMAAAQVKIGDNPTNIGASSAVEIESTNRALVLSRVANTASIAQPVEGMIVYDISTRCLKAYENGAWTNCLSNGSNIEQSTNGTAIVSSYTCSTASAGTLYAGVIPGSVSQTITATVTAAGTYNLSATSNGIVFSGSGTFTFPGTHQVVLTAIGLPASVGTNTFNLNTLPTCGFTRQTLANPSSGGSAVVSAYNCSTASAGILTSGVAASGVTQTITATVTTPGTYNISTITANGITFSGSGTFAGTGAQTVVLTASGTPAAATTSNYTLTTTPNCNFNRTVTSVSTNGTAVVSAYNCAGGSLGTMTVGTAVSGVTQIITATVITAGTYSISIPAVNGISWTGSGTFAGAGSQSITLTASGTPLAAGTTSFSMNTTPTCSFTRSVGETFTAALCGTQYGVYPTNVPIGGTSVTVTKTGTSTNNNYSTNCGIPFTSLQLTGSGQYASYTFSVPLKNVQVYGISNESTEGQEGYAVTASLNGTPVAVQAVNTGLGSCPANFTASQSGNTGNIQNTVSGNSSGLVFNISAAGYYDTITITRIGSAGQGTNAHALAFCNATALFNPSSGGSAVISAISCSGTAAGFLTAGAAASGVTQVITATVTTPGTYYITTAAVNGVTWSGSGTFAGTGAQNIILTASGTPVAGGTNTFTLGSTPSCSFSRDVNYAFDNSCNANFLGNGYPYTGTVDGQSLTVNISGTGGYFNGSIGASCGGSMLNNVILLSPSQYFTHTFSKPIYNLKLRASNLEAAEGNEGFSISATRNGVAVPVIISPSGGCAANFVVNNGSTVSTVRDMYGTGADLTDFNILSAATYDTVTITRLGGNSGGFYYFFVLCPTKVVP